MGYRCPVCEEPQLDGEHLANHLGFTAMIRSEDHAAWLDDHVEGWKELRPPELAEQVTPLAPEAELPEEADATDAEGHDHAPPRERGRGPYSEPQQGARDRNPNRNQDREELTDEAKEVMAEARAMTREIHEKRAEAAETEANENENKSDDGDADEGDGEREDAGADDATDGNA